MKSLRKNTVDAFGKKTRDQRFRNVCNGGDKFLNFQFIHSTTDAIEGLLLNAS